MTKFWENSPFGFLRSPFGRILRRKFRFLLAQFSKFMKKKIADAFLLLQFLLHVDAYPYDIWPVSTSFWLALPHFPEAASVIEVVVARS